MGGIIFGQVFFLFLSKNRATGILQSLFSSFNNAYKYLLNLYER